MNLRMNTDTLRSRMNFIVGTALAVLGLLLAGCSLLPQAQPDPTRIYILSNRGGAAESGSKGPAVYLRPVELASYIKSKPMIVRRGDNEIEFREFARWGEPLELGIGRVLREELLTRGAAGIVLAAGLRAVGVEYDYALTVRVLACEGGAGGAVFFRAAWELSTASDAPKIVAQGDYRPGDLRWDGKNESTLAAQLSQAVSGLAAEISGALAKTK
ncbi:MAG: membrane integrity-associated transporter subunit PqiC [Opitutus sp.]|nr:membrane integrity-associated transporter subunit PqiC [Opitutus sp.]